MMDEFGGDEGGGMDPRLESKMRMLAELQEWAQSGMKKDLESEYRQGPGDAPADIVDAEGAVTEKTALGEDGLPDSESADALLGALDEDAVRKLLGEG